MADSADIDVDDLRRRARRRLVGAIVLALGAAVIVPMLLESEPKPLGDSVAVKIPPVDDGRFVNRLSDNTKPDAPARDIRKDPAAGDAAARKSVGEAEKAVIAPSSKAPKYDTQIAGDKAAPAAAVEAPPPVASAMPQVATPAPEAPSAAPPTVAEPAKPPEVKAAPAAKTETAPAKAEAALPKSETKAAVPAPATPKSESHEGFAVQLAAFSDDKGANSLANRLKRAGYPAYTEPLKTSRGTLWRVRVGPYASRDAANGVRDKLKAEGQNGIVAASR